MTELPEPVARLIRRFILEDATRVLLALLRRARAAASLRKDAWFRC
jgi:hypothetical protein